MSAAGAGLGPVHRLVCRSHQPGERIGVFRVQREADTGGTMQRVGLLRPTPLAHELLQLSSQTRLSLVFAGRDISHGVFVQEAGYSANLLSEKLDIRRIAGADHTFTEPKARAALAAEIKSLLC